MGALEDLGKDRENARAGEVVGDDEGDLAVGREAILIRSDLHSAAEELTVRCRSEPDLLVLFRHAVNGDGGVSRLIIVKKSAQSDGGIIDRLFLILALTVAGLADVTVEPEADVVEKREILAVYADEGKILNVFADVKGLGASRLAEVVEEIVAASRAVIIYLLLYLESAGIVYEMMKRAVSAREDNDAIVIAGNEEIIIASERGYINVSYLAVGQNGVERASRRFCLTVIRQRVIKYNIIFQGELLRKNQFRSINIFYHYFLDFSRGF